MLARFGCGYFDDLRVSNATGSPAQAPAGDLLV
jgi:hypothetical protein